VRAGGIALIAGALAFMAVFAFLAARFDYPGILDGPAAVVLPRLLETGSSGRLAWAIYAFLPLVWLPAGVGAWRAFRRTHPGAMMLALLFAAVSAIAMMLGLMRWPSLHWRLAELQATATPEQQQVIAAVFDGLNTYLGNYIGEFLGELAASAFFLLSSWAMLRSRAVPAWVAGIGLVTGVAGLAGMFRNVSAVADPVAAVNNYLLPLWMIVFGVVLLRHRVDDVTAPKSSRR
jgi:hypothetical protein